MSPHAITRIQWAKWKSADYHRHKTARRASRRLYMQRWRKQRTERRNQLKPPMPPKIQSNIPLPKPRRKWKSTLQKLKVNSTFFEPMDPQKLRNGINSSAKKMGIVLAVHKATEKGVEGTRVWRVS